MLSSTGILVNFKRVQCTLYLFSFIHDNHATRDMITENEHAIFDDLDLEWF